MSIYILYLIFKKRYELIIVTSMPPVISAFTVMIACRIKKIRFIYYCMDIYPEVGKISGDFKNKIIYKSLLHVDSKTCLYANPVLVHSQDMLKTLSARPQGHKFNIKTLNNFYKNPIGSSDDYKFDVQYNNSKLTVVYAGNLGRFQNLNLMLDIIHKVDSSKIEFVFVGDGVMRQHLINRAQIENIDVTFLGHKSPQKVKKYIKEADICLITLDKGVINCAYPSKTMAYLAQGKPLLALVENNCELASMIVRRRIGFILDADNLRSCTELLHNISIDKEWIMDANVNAKKAFYELFSDHKILKKWDLILKY